MNCEFNSVWVMRFLHERDKRFLMAVSKRLESKRPSLSFAAAKNVQYQDMR